MNSRGMTFADVDEGELSKRFLIDGRRNHKFPKEGGEKILREDVGDTL